MKWHYQKVKQKLWFGLLVKQTNWIIQVMLHICVNGGLEHTDRTQGAFGGMSICPETLSRSSNTNSSSIS